MHCCVSPDKCDSLCSLIYQLCLMGIFQGLVVYGACNKEKKNPRSIRGKVEALKCCRLWDLKEQNKMDEVCTVIEGSLPSQLASSTFHHLSIILASCLPLNV